MTQEEPNVYIKCKLCRNIYNEVDECIAHFIKAHKFDIFELVFLNQK